MFGLFRSISHFNVSTFVRLPTVPNSLHYWCSPFFVCLLFESLQKLVPFLVCFVPKSRSQIGPLLSTLLPDVVKFGWTSGCRCYGVNPVSDNKVSVSSFLGPRLRPCLLQSPVYTLSNLDGELVELVLGDETPEKLVEGVGDGPGTPSRRLTGEVRSTVFVSPGRSRGWGLGGRRLS